ncbi:amino acid ABC transporter permease [Sporolactobacillus sp. STCC-11]|uniref:amino acid ABC transporter permease n=1 Tax=Sporolactobacillus caesalpiniae TaxID=3230362 RepID=UPI003396AE17
MDFSVILTKSNLLLLLSGLGYTILFSVVSFALSIIIGVIVAFGQMSKIKVIHGLSVFYLSWFRGTPLLVQLFLMYYGLPLLLGITTVPWVSGILSLGLYSGSYSSQIIRGAIQSIGKGQMEAGRSLGFSYAQTMKKIILPQAALRTFAPLTNEFISVTKNSALLSTITVVELFREANLIMSSTYRTLETLIVASILYYIFNNLIGFVGSWFEKHFRTGEELR